VSNQKKPDPVARAIRVAPEYPRGQPVTKDATATRQRRFRTALEQEERNVISNACFGARVRRNFSRCAKAAIGYLR